MTRPVPAAAAKPALRDPDARLHAASGEPDGFDHDPGTDDVGWDLGSWCRVTFGWDFDRRQVLAHVAIRDGNEARSVTPAQVRAFAARLIGLADRADARTAQTPGSPA